MSPDRSSRSLASLATLLVVSGGLSVIAEAQTPPAPPHKAHQTVAPASASAKPDSPEAQPAPAPGASNIGAPPANAISTNPVAQQGKVDTGGAFFGHVGFAGAYERPALAGMVGAKLQLSTDWMIGLDAEWNPWISIDTKTLRSGVVNVYASILRRYQLRYEAVNLRTTASVGASRLMFDLYGARQGSIGPYLGISFLAIEWKLANRWYLVLDPSNIAFPVPHVTGVPLGYLQYRATVGLDVQLF